jgi:hypothetical protein
MFLTVLYQYKHCYFGHYPSPERFFKHKVPESRFDSDSSHRDSRSNGSVGNGLRHWFLKEVTFRSRFQNGMLGKLKITNSAKKNGAADIFGCCFRALSPSVTEKNHPVSGLLEPATDIIKQNHSTVSQILPTAVPQYFCVNQSELRLSTCSPISLCTVLQIGTCEIYRCHSLISCMI